MRNVLIRLVVLLLVVNCCRAENADTDGKKVIKENISNNNEGTNSKSIFWEQNFDIQISGQKPEKWCRAWGTKDDDQLIVSNLQAISGKNSLLLDRKTGLNQHMWGVALRFPHVNSPQFTLSFCFLIEGTGNEACFSFEIRGADANTDRVVTLSVRNRNVYLITNNKSVKNRKKKSVLLGKYEPGEWYRVKLILPTSGKLNLKAYGSLYSYKKENIVTENSPQSVDINLPKKKYGILMLNTAPGKRNYRLFIDDIVIQEK